MQAQALLANSSSIPFPQHDPPIHKRLLCSLTLGRVREYFKAARALAPFFLSPTSSNTTSTFITLHFKLDCYFPFFLKDYEPHYNFELSFNSFKLAFQRMSHLSTSGPSGMVFEHLRDCCHLENLANGFP